MMIKAFNPDLSKTFKKILFILFLRGAILEKCKNKTGQPSYYMPQCTILSPGVGNHFITLLYYLTLLENLLSNQKLD